MTNQQEQDLGTQPVVADTDDDGLDDAAETKTWVYVSADNTGTDPLNPDSDGDGLADGAETNSGTNPTLVDSDLDGLPDQWEADHGTNPNDPSSPKTIALKDLGVPSVAWNALIGLPSFDGFGGGLDKADATFRLWIDFEPKQIALREVIFETGGATVGFSLVYEAGNKLVLRATGNGGFSLAVAEALLPANSLIAGGEVEVMWTYDVENDEGTQTIALWLNQVQVAAVSMDLGGDWSGANDAEFGTYSSNLAGSGSNTGLVGGYFLSGSINLDKGLQFFGNRLPEIDSGDPGPLAITDIERATSGEVTLTWASNAGTNYAVEYQQSLEDAPWTQIATGLNGVNLTTSFTDTNSKRRVEPAGFYRVREE